MQMRYKLVAALVLAGTALSAQAQMKPEDSILYRQAS